MISELTPGSELSDEAVPRLLKKGVLLATELSGFPGTHCRLRPVAVVGGWKGLSLEACSFAAYQGRSPVVSFRVLSHRL